MTERFRPVRCTESVEKPGLPWHEWPCCGWFLSKPWRRVYGTQDGTIYAWGGICKRHGEVSDST